MYQINVDRVAEVFDVALGGMMGVDEVAAYIADLRGAHARHGFRSYAMVIDVRQCPIQSQDMIRAMGECMAAMPKARALAVVVGSSLARMQVRRLFTQPYARIVTDPDEGRAWAYSGIEPGAAAA